MFDNQQVNNQNKATGVTGKEQEPNGLPAENSNQQESQRTKNGLWINQLPKTLRSNFDGEEMPTIGDLARDYLRLKELEGSKEKDNGSTKKYSKEHYEGVRKYFAQGDTYDGRRDTAIFDLLVESDVDPTKLASILDEKPTQADVDRAMKAAQAQYEKNLSTLWGEKLEENKSLLDRALEKLDEKTKNELQSTGEQYSPIVADLLVKLEKAQNPGTQGKGTNSDRILSDIEKMWGTTNRK